MTDVEVSLMVMMFVEVLMDDGEDMGVYSCGNEVSTWSGCL